MKVKITSKVNGDTLTVEGDDVQRALLHAAGGGHTEDQTAAAMEANAELREGFDVTLGKFHFEKVQS